MGFQTLFLALNKIKQNKIIFKSSNFKGKDIYEDMVTALFLLSL